MSEHKLEAAFQGQPDTTEEPCVYILLDNSNVWIEGARAASRETGANAQPDRTWRVNVGFLLEHIVRGRHFIKGILFGVSAQESLV
jgi:hypothetical protein